MRRRVETEGPICTRARSSRGRAASSRRPRRQAADARLNATSPQHHGHLPCLLTWRRLAAIGSAVVGTCRHASHVPIRQHRHPARPARHSAGSPRAGSVARLLSSTSGVTSRKLVPHRSSCPLPPRIAPCTAPRRNVVEGDLHCLHHALLVTARLCRQFHLELRHGRRQGRPGDPLTQLTFEGACSGRWTGLCSTGATCVTATVVSPRTAPFVAICLMSCLHRDERPARSRVLRRVRFSFDNRHHHRIYLTPARSVVANKRRRVPSREGSQTRTTRRLMAVARQPLCNGRMIPLVDAATPPHLLHASQIRRVEFARRSDCVPCRYFERVTMPSVPLP